jgi:DNA invertase Pin-like site-specific DNA recombinase
MKRVAIYARSSPDCPISTNEQIECLRRVAAERGYTVTSVFSDRPTAVRKGPDRRPGESALLNVIQSSAIDRVHIWSVCRIGKSLIDLVKFMETCRAACVAVTLHDEGFYSETSNGLSLFDVSALLARHVRQSRRDRILRGQAAARSLSIRLGRPPLTKSTVEKAKQFLAAGRGVREIARLASISPTSVSRIKTSMTQRPPV